MPDEPRNHHAENRFKLQQQKLPHRAPTTWHHAQESTMIVMRKVVNQMAAGLPKQNGVIELSDSGYTTPIQRKDIKVLGRSALGALYAGINGMWRGNYATDHDALVARKLAYVMCGGDLSETNTGNRTILARPGT